MEGFPASSAAAEIGRPIVHECERYEFVREIGSGNFGVARLMRDKLSGEFVAVKYIERGDKVCSLSLSLSDLLILIA